jgi:hypothetical protein
MYGSLQSTNITTERLTIYEGLYLHNYPIILASVYLLDIQFHQEEVTISAQSDASRPLSFLNKHLFASALTWLESKEFFEF